MPNSESADSGASRRDVAFNYAVRSDTGIVRENNEDCAYARADLLVLADGMGGHASGEIASSVALHTFAGVEASGTEEQLLDAAVRTREILRAMSAADPTLATMGTTLVAVTCAGGECHLSHIGDSRVYALRGGELQQLTTDHTHVQHLVQTGRITPEQVPTHPYRAMLLKSLDDQFGGSPPDVAPLVLTEGDRLLLCSDGLSDYVPALRIQQALETADAGEAADALVAAALAAGTRDNVTVIVADVVAPANGPAPQFAGAAASPLRLSPPAAEALARVAPEFRGEVEVIGAEVDDPLTRTTLLPATPDPDAADPGAIDPGSIDTGSAGPFAGIFAVGAVALVALAIALLL